MTLARMLDPLFAPGASRFRIVGRDGIRRRRLGGRELLEVSPDLLHRVAFEALRDANFFYRTGQLEAWARLLADGASSENERFTAAALLANAAISAEMVLPSCQDTGTATVIGLKGEGVATGAEDEEAIEAGIREAYASCNLRFSQVAPVSMFDDRPTGTNLPAQVDIHAAGAGGPGGAEYRLLFAAKGGGSANKTTLTQATRTLLSEHAFERFLSERVASLGVSACPPYVLAVVVGGTSAEANLQMLKLGTCDALDHLPAFGGTEGVDDVGAAWRDPVWEERLRVIARECGLGAQFGGIGLALDARVIRLPRHAASLPVSVGVSCSAHRCALARIASDGAWLEDLDRDPARFLPRATAELERRGAGAPRIDLDRPPREICRALSGLGVGALVLLDGPLLLARDAAHARFSRALEEGRGLPQYLGRHAIYYAGPAQTPKGRAIGSLGPTTAERMDPYVGRLMAAGASLVMLAKGNRSSAVAEACRQHGGFSLATVGGAAALMAGTVRSAEVIDYADLGMEAVRRIVVKGLPAIIAIDDRGSSLYASAGSQAGS